MASPAMNPCMKPTYDASGPPAPVAINIPRARARAVSLFATQCGASM
jgi:hypothetical protein